MSKLREQLEEKRVVRAVSSTQTSTAEEQPRSLNSRLEYLDDEQVQQALKARDEGYIIDIERCDYYDCFALRKKLDVILFYAHGRTREIEVHNEKLIRQKI